MPADTMLPPWAARLQSERGKRGWNKHEMARRLLRAAGIEQTPIRIKSLVRQVSWWERGKHYPRDWDTAYATAFETTVTKLFGTKPAYLQPATAPSVDGDDARDEWNDEMYRRAAIQLLGALSAGTAIPVGALETVLSAVGRTLDDRAELDLADWEETAWEYGQTFRTTPPGTLIGDVTADLVALGRILDRAHARAERADLLRICADLTRLLAWEFGDIGEQRAARRSWRAARRFADSAGDNVLAARIRNHEADSAIWLSRPDPLIGRLLDEALRLTAAPNAQLAASCGVRAKLLALGGDKAGALAALNTCTSMLDRLSGNILNPVWFVTSDAYVRVLTGDRHPRQAVERALALAPASQAGPHATLRLVHALYLVKDREVREGVDQALACAQNLPLSAARRRITGQILAALPDGKARALPAARELRALTAGAVT